MDYNPQCISIYSANNTMKYHANENSITNINTICWAINFLHLKDKVFATKNNRFSHNDSEPC